MNRYFLAFLMTIFSFSAFSQSAMPKNSEGRYEYAEVVTVDSSTDADLFSKAKLFLSKAFTSGKAVTDLSDENSKTIIAKGWMPARINVGMGFQQAVEVHFTVTIQTKPNRYRYTINEFVGTIDLQYNHQTTPYENQKGLKINAKAWDRLLEETDRLVQSLIKDMKTEMASKKNGDW